MVTKPTWFHYHISLAHCSVIDYLKLIMEHGNICDYKVTTSFSDDELQKEF